MNVKTNQFGGALLFILGEFAAAEEEMIEDGGMEVYGEDDQGREGSCEVSINELAQAASDEIKHLKEQLAKANERVAELEQELKNGIFEASCYDVDVIQCLNKMAYEHNEKEIPRFRDIAKDCAERISTRTSDLNKFAIEKKVEAINEALDYYEELKASEEPIGAGSILHVCLGRLISQQKQLRKEQE